MKLLRTLTVLSIFCTTLNVYAQALQDDQQIPGRRSAEQAMLRRLVEIAEGSPPTKEALSTEFGFSYQKLPYFSEERPQFFATGNLPFEPKYASRLQYDATSGSAGARDLSFEFAVRQPNPSDSAKRFCISQEAFIRALLSNNWIQQERIYQPHAIKATTFLRSVGGFNRTVFFFPEHVHCVQVLQIRYAILINSSQIQQPTSKQNTQGK